MHVVFGKVKHVSSTDRLADAAVGARVRAARAQRALSLRSLAGELGISPTTLSQIETGKVRLSVVRLNEIAAALGTTATAILGQDMVEAGKDPGRPTPSKDWRIFNPLEFDPVLSAALAEFLRVGYHGASVRDIARRVGVSVSGLYHYYPGKQEILHTLLQRAVNEMLWRTRAARAEGRDPVERFSLLIECLVLFTTYRRELALIGISETRSLEPGNYRQIVALRRCQRQMVSEEVAAAVSLGRFTTTAPEEAAIAVVAMCLSVAQWYRPSGSLTPEQVAAHHVRFALDLMRPA
jgi:AcrR family transcriptional regulator/DNA-binding XRE family transcriptional regulator